MDAIIAQKEPRGIALNEILTIPPEEYDQWTICLNNGENGLSETLYSQDFENTKSIMRHLSYKKDLKKTTVSVLYIPNIAFNLSGFITKRDMTM